MFIAVRRFDGGLRQCNCGWDTCFSFRLNSIRGRVTEKIYSARKTPRLCRRYLLLCRRYNNFVCDYILLGGNPCLLCLHLSSGFKTLGKISTRIL